ncbi:hypothetical protein AB1N83_014273 [Pleurotus pulmonarius]
MPIRCGEQQDAKSPPLSANDTRMGRSRWSATSRSTMTSEGSSEDSRRSREGDEAQTQRADARLGTCADGVKARIQHGRSTHVPL